MTDCFKRKLRKAIIRKPVNIVLRIPAHVHDDLMQIKGACKSFGINVSLQNIMIALIIVGKTSAEQQLGNMVHAGFVGAIRNTSEGKL